MKKFIILGMLAGIIFAGLAKPAAAQTMPNMAGLRPFQAETNYMSLAGFVRWQHFVATGVWITRSEAKSLIANNN